MRKASGKSCRNDLTVPEVAAVFHTEEKARQWIEELRWPDGPHCPHCGSFNVQCNIKHKSQTHRCRDCPNKPQFTVRVGTIMHRSHLTHQEWAIGLYLYTTSIKGVSPMRLHRELGISQKSAWFLMHRLHKASESGEALRSGPVGADDARIGGKRKNKSNSKYFNGFARSEKVRDKETIDQTKDIVRGMAGKRRQFSDLIADNGPSSGARS